MKLVLNGMVLGDCDAYEQYGRPYGAAGYDEGRNGWRFKLANGIEINIPYYLIERFDSTCLMNGRIARCLNIVTYSQDDPELLQKRVRQRAESERRFDEAFHIIPATTEREA